MRQVKNIFIVIGFALIVYSCSPAKGNRTGHEFMPDMVHSTAYEANYYTYYYFNTWGSEDTYKEFAFPRKPVPGTIARGFTGKATTSYTIPLNGSVPYYYEDTEEERTRAINEIIQNPFPITEAGLQTGKELYEILCGICHGEKGDGAGYLARDGSPYPAQPAILTSDEFTTSSNGRFYHAIMYGKNVMSGYADKLSYEERWQVIHYIRSLQAKNKNLVYNEEENTLNEVDIPAAQIPVPLQEMESQGHSNEDHETEIQGESTNTHNNH